MTVPDRAYSQVFQSRGYRAKLIIYDQRESPVIRYRAEPVAFYVYVLDRVRYPNPSTAITRAGTLVYGGPSFTLAWAAVLKIFESMSKIRWPELTKKFLPYLPIVLDEATVEQRAQLVRYVPFGELQQWDAAHGTTYAVDLREKRL